MTQRKERTGIEVQSERAILAAVRLPGSNYDRREPFGELRALAQQAGAQAVGELVQMLDRPVSGTFMGSGKVQELKALCEELKATTIIFDNDLSPKQIGAIEEVTQRKVIDRSELILDIFASRATTAEAQLQVELAQLEYTYPRIRGMWSHLERMAGGGIGTRGPGEMQLEIDRRLVQKRQVDLRHRLAEIQARKRREVFERKREHFTVGLVGYTNAGKSTLFNTLTRGGAYADDRLFATLITRTRQWELGGSVTAMLSDTVGFVRDLPHNLVASFKATLEEATHADILLIVLDVSDPSAEMHYETVMKTLDELFEEVEKSSFEEDKGWTPPERLLLLNKVDKLKSNAELLVWQQKVPRSLAICALPGKPGAVPLGQDQLAAMVQEAVLGPIEEMDITLPIKDSRTIHIIESQSKVLDREYTEDTVRLQVQMGRKQIDRMRGAGVRMKIRDAKGADVPAPIEPGTISGGWTGEADSRH